MKHFFLCVLGGNPKQRDLSLSGYYLQIRESIHLDTFLKHLLQFFSYLITIGFGERKTNNALSQSYRRFFALSDKTKDLVGMSPIK